MKRSTINEYQREAVRFLAKRQFFLHPWAFWSSKAWKEKVGAEEVIEKIITEIQERKSANQNTVTVALDGWYGVPWQKITSELSSTAEKLGLEFEMRNISLTYLSKPEIDAYKNAFTDTGDPGFEEKTMLKQGILK